MGIQTWNEDPRPGKRARPVDATTPPRDGSASPPHKRKRPGQSSRVPDANKAAAEQLRKQHEANEKASNLQARINNPELVAAHYNNVPERGRNWRTTDSQIKGLRSLNNWIKSTLIQKFSPGERSSLNVLDMACGKGGDLGKWEKAPILPSLYVGCDIAAVSIEQAQQRYDETLRKSSGRTRRPVMRAEFYHQDSFGQTLANVPAVRRVGFNATAGPTNSTILPGQISGGFDVVSMMFALHYSFESEAIARQMLANVSGALKKGGRFIGVMPNSDVISSTVKMLLHDHIEKSPHSMDSPTTPQSESDDWDPEKPSIPDESASLEIPGRATETIQPIQPQRGIEDARAQTKPASIPDEPASLRTPERATETTQPIQSPPETETAQPIQPPLEWGNSIFSVKFPRNQRPLPKDGVFRPPYGWKYHYYLTEAVEAPEYVVPWEGFRALAMDYGLELQYRRSFTEVWEDEKDDPELGVLAERMGVRSRDRSQPRGGLRVSEEEMEAAAFYHAFCFYKN